MREKDLERLEFFKIKDKLKTFSHSEATQTLIEELTPFTEREQLERELELTRVFFEIKDSVPIYEFVDIRDYLKRAKIEGSLLSVEELLNLGNLLKLIREVRRAIGSLVERYPVLKRLSSKLHLFSGLENLIEASIDRRGFVRDEASEELLKVRRAIRGIEKEIMERLENLLRRPDADSVFSDKIITIRSNRYVVPVKTSQVKKIFGIIHGTSSSGYTTYIEPQFVIHLNNKLTELKGEEEDEVKKILQKITSYVKDFSQKIEESFEVLVYIDLIKAKVELGKLFDGTFPQIGDFVELREAKHPLLSILKEDTVPVDILMKERRGLILTGPNTGGKTVSLKTLGLIALMFQSAMPVPVKEGSVLPIFKNIFVDIGDEQSIEQNLSSFSSHVSNLAEFLDVACENTLVLLDELGAGTDPMEGSALAIGILEYLKDKEAWVFANTHHTPVKLYAVNSQYFIPASVLFDPATLNPLYRVAYNSVGESMAFEIAQAYGLPQEVVERAKEVIGNLGESYREATKQLSEYVREYESRLREIESKEKQLEEALKKYERLIEEYEEHKRKAWRDIYKEARIFLQKLRAKAESTVETSKEDIERLVAESEKQLKLFVNEEKPGIMVGDAVKFMGKEGRVLKLEGDRAYITSGSFKFWVDVANLEKLEKTLKQTSVKLRDRKPSKKLKEIDLTGLSVEEAKFALEKFLEEAHSAGVRSIKIVHGIGTGKLKGMVRELLSNSEKVRFFREAYPNEGGSGVTVAYLS